LFEVLDSLIKNIIYDLSDGEMFFERDSKCLEVTSGQTGLVNVVRFPSIF
jgi:hypothetical protein